MNGGSQQLQLSSERFARNGNVLDDGGNDPDAQPKPVLEAFVFGRFRIVPYARLLEHNGLPVPLSSRAFDLLCLLIDRAGEVVSKAELIAKAWPDVTVEESSLRFHITMLRRALGDGRGGERYVVNVPGRGYCFVSWVCREGSALRPTNGDRAPGSSHSVRAELQLAAL